MSFFLPGITPGSVSFDLLDSSSTAKAPVITPTANQQIQGLASTGQSASVIASSLGVPVSQVDTALGITTTTSPTSEASALVALSGRLSVQA